MATLNVRVGLTGLARRIVADGLMGEAEVLEAQKAALRQGAPLVAYLVAGKLVDPRALAAAASEEFGVPLVDLDTVDHTQAPIQEVDKKLIRQHHALPLFRRGKRLFVAISDPTNLQALDEIKFQTSSFVEPIVVEEDKLAHRLEKALEAIDTAMSALTDSDLDNLEVSTSEEINVTEDITREDLEDAPIVRFVNKVMLDAIRKGASDIHFEPYERFYRVRLRQDGMLREIAQPPTALAPKIAARLKVMARLDISERRVPQDGRIKIRLSQNRAVDFRVNTCPTLYGEKIVLRILDPSSAKLGIDALGYEDFQKQLYLDALNRPHGMILVTGPTGSGKTVSLYTGVNILNTGDCNICTAEDPVEIQLPGVNQLNVQPKVGLTFASALRAFLRQDPDVILVGEIRDLETAEIGIKAAQTGHLVLSTLHTNDAPKTLSRLVDIGVAPYAIATAVNLIIAQRLTRRLCNNCKQPVNIPAEALIKEGFSEAEVAAGIEAYGPTGCDQCTDGYRGRTGIYQVMPVSEETGRIIMAGGNAMQLAEQAEREGVWSMRKAGLQKVKNGITSLEELSRVTTE